MQAMRPLPLRMLQPTRPKKEGPLGWWASPRRRITQMTSGVGLPGPSEEHVGLQVAIEGEEAHH